MLIGNINTIPSIVNLPGQSSRPGGYAFKFEKEQLSVFALQNAAEASLENIAISCWIKINPEFFTGTTSDGYHIIDKFVFPGPKGYRLMLQRAPGQAQERRLTWEIGFNQNGPRTTSIDVGGLSANTVYLVTASVNNRNTRLNIRGVNGVSLEAGRTLDADQVSSPFPLAIGNGNPTSLLNEFNGSIDEVAIWSSEIMTAAATNEIFDWRNNKDLNNLSTISAPDYWWQMGENATQNASNEWVLPNIGTQTGSAVDMVGSGTTDNRIEPGLPNELYG